MCEWEMSSSRYMLMQCWLDWSCLYRRYIMLMYIISEECVTIILSIYPNSHLQSELCTRHMHWSKRMQM